MIEPNPLWTKCARARLRLRHILSWGTVTVTVTLFVCLMVFLTATEQNDLDRETAARSLILPIVIIQAIIIMLLGTGAVAGGLSQEREAGLVDYHRMSPMTPTGKIIGYLLGLPIREYFLLALTLPFLLFAIVAGKMPLLTIIHFYCVFLTSVWVYHMTALVAGMTSSKPRRAAILAQGMVVVLYLILPQLSLFGLTFFEYLTIRPTLIGVLMPVATEGDPRSASAWQEFGTYEAVPFFSTFLHPTAYTFLLQGFLLAFMFLVVHRKWSDESRHPLSKTQAFALYAGTMVLLVGNLWPVIANEAVLTRLINRLDGPDMDETAQLLFGVMLVMIFVSLVIALMLIHVSTPSRHVAIKEIRRASRLELPRIRASSDGASSLPLTFAMCLLTCAGLVTLTMLALNTGRFLASGPNLVAAFLPLVLLTALLVFVQALRECSSGRAFFVTLFLFWAVPCGAGTILFAAFEAWVPGTYIALPCPPFAIALVGMNYFEAASYLPNQEDIFSPPPITPHVTTLAALGTGGYLLLAILMQIILRRWKAGVRTEALALP